MIDFCKIGHGYVQEILPAVIEAGAFAKQTSRSSFSQSDKDFGDIVTSTDHECERIILKAIQSRYPDHSIYFRRGWDAN